MRKIILVSFFWNSTNNDLIAAAAMQHYQFLEGKEKVKDAKAQFKERVSSSVGNVVISLFFLGLSFP